MSKLNIFPITAAVISLLVSSADNDLEVMTVKGFMDASEMGTTLIHEDVLVDWIGAGRLFYGHSASVF